MNAPQTKVDHAAMASIIAMVTFVVWSGLAGLSGMMAGLPA